ncbi:hypothetical protein [Streptomyces sp. NBC_01237]|uniref:hypothetical protein n=1 Tax=Streptomyces sp. NBC_01237 TaxID=2903790 RepID=UPI002DD8EECA|nr:hypothetical protein [Streptomyces sp. NBC_01237]WRZ72877.1 hypothetical protein OG251_15265 [Streptomyces sp. NBC_01237]
MERHASIAMSGTQGTIRLDGQDISSCVQRLTLTGDVRTGTHLELGLVLEEVQHDGQTQVYLPARTAELLTALGWTPPADSDPTAADLHPLPKLQHDDGHTVIDQATIVSEPVQVLPEQAYADLVRWASRYFPPQ